jgi:OmpA-OmpF porin, OOP family
MLLLPTLAEAQGKVRRSDRDGDGLKNKRDHCPDEAGPLSLFGCPDRDGDGVPDKDDVCPDDPGLIVFQGCPDRDGDGVPDLHDECPDVRGLAERKGCPDRDGDGVVDDLDQCPDEAGSEQTFGCPDRDEDGIADKDDDCPDEPGDVSARGCPDRDGDGVADREDRCPNTPGPKERGGCPPIAVADEELMARSADRLRFDDGGAALNADARAYLDEVAAMLGRYADFSIYVYAHTDTQGDAGELAQLSERQAQSVARYLSAKGVSPTRIETAGFGGMHPVANNIYPEGRARNRRVEIGIKE